MTSVLASKEISSDLFLRGGISHNEDIMHSFQRDLVSKYYTYSNRPDLVAQFAELELVFQKS